LWAVFDPAGWFRNFPGFGDRLVAAAGGPFNEHLATDAGAAFVATGIGLVVAAVVATRSGALIALVAQLAFAVPHLLFHVLNPSGSAGSSANVSGLVSLGISVGFPVLLLVWNRAPRESDDPSETAVDSAA
jgi:hypothetical protein